MSNRVLMVSMPFGALDRPALGLSLLKATLEQRGIRCDVRYLTFDLADRIGPDVYRWVSNDLPYTAFAGDWLFTDTLYGARSAATRDYVNVVLRQTWRLSDADIQRLLSIRAMLEPYLEHCLSSVSWDEYRVIGFTSTFEQNIASLALAQRLRQAYPDLVIVFGGANWEGAMGLELHRQFPFVDYVCSGEADETFPALLEHEFTDWEPCVPKSHVRGIIYRDGPDSVYTGQAAPVRNLDALPTPDFDDYFEAAFGGSTRASIMPMLLMETSRGCWWGAKSHCTFCGLNGGSMSYRSKTPNRALREINELVQRWGITQVEVVDNILDMRYFREFLPALAETEPRLQIFYEVKSNLRREHVATLAAAGVERIQPGIESMNDHVLRLMRKGTTALRNVQLLKWCKQFGVAVDWNVLFGFPGETRDDYARMLELLKAIRFLQAPCACGPVRLDRFSPYFSDPNAFGLTNVRPIVSYRYLYPFAPSVLARIAYYFDFDYAPDMDPRGYANEVIEFCDRWQKQPEKGSLLSMARNDGTLVILDRRGSAPHRSFELSSTDRTVYEYCDQIRTIDGIVRHLNGLYSDLNVARDDVRAHLTSLVANELMVADGEHYLSLAIPVPRPKHSASATTQEVCA